MPEDASLQSRIDVVVSHTPLGFIYDLFTPTISLNGQAHKRPWGTSTFSLPPGHYEVSVSYPWLFASECGKNTIGVTVQSGETKTVTYCAGLIRYLPGKISVR